MDYLREGIHLRGFAQIDPLVAYKNEGFSMFQVLMNSIWEEFARLIFHVEVEVANFYPAIASAISRWVYENTQSRIHVLVTHGFLRRLARLDLAESRARRFARIEDLPDPVPARERPSRTAASRSAA